MKTKNKILFFAVGIITLLSIIGFVSAASPGVKPAQCYYAPQYISMDTAARYALNAGFTKDNAITIVAISWAESSGNIYACRYNPGSWDRGILQINNYWHSEVSDAQAFNPENAFRAGYNIWRTRGFREWVAYNNGNYIRYISSATNAVNRVMICSPGARRCNGNKVETCTNGLNWILVQNCGSFGRCVSGRCYYYV